MSKDWDVSWVGGKENPIKIDVFADSKRIARSIIVHHFLMANIS